MTTSRRIRSGGGSVFASTSAFAPSVATRTLHMSFRIEFTTWMLAGASSTTKTVFFSSGFIWFPVCCTEVGDRFKLDKSCFEFEMVDRISQSFQLRLLDQARHRCADCGKNLAGGRVAAFQKGLQTDDGVPSLDPIKRSRWQLSYLVSHCARQRLLNRMDLSREYRRKLIE